MPQSRQLIDATSTEVDAMLVAAGSVLAASWQDSSSDGCGYVPAACWPPELAHGGTNDAAFVMAWLVA
jgi:hypothetical protein